MIHTYIHAGCAWLTYHRPGADANRYERDNNNVSFVIRTHVAYTQMYVQKTCNLIDCAMAHHRRTHPTGIINAPLSDGHRPIGFLQTLSVQTQKRHRDVCTPRETETVLRKCQSVLPIWHRHDRWKELEIQLGERCVCVLRALR